MATTKKTTDSEEIPVNTLNEWMISKGQNMDNHTMSMKGRKHFVRQGRVEPPTFRTKQEAYRYCAYVLTMADVFLPDEEGAHGFEEVLHAIQNA